jgi:5-methylcytosine-specific restriction endonuclease McrA
MNNQEQEKYIFKKEKDKEQKEYKNKKNIPKAIRQQVWLKYIGKKFEDKCSIIWCQNIISVFNFHAGHNIPESKGGTIDINNLKPICSNCNLSMSDKYTIDEWNNLGLNKNIKEDYYSVFYLIKYIKSYFY